MSRKIGKLHWVIYDELEGELFTRREDWTSPDEFDPDKHLFSNRQTVDFKLKAASTDDMTDEDLEWEACRRRRPVAREVIVSFKFKDET